MQLKKIKFESVERIKDKIINVIGVLLDSKLIINSVTKNDILNFNFNALTMYNLCDFSNSENKNDFEFSDKLINCINEICMEDMFNSYPLHKKYRIVGTLVEEFCDYLGIETPKFVFRVRNKVEFLCDNGYIKEMKDCLTENEFEQFLKDYYIITFGLSDASNTLDINYFSNKYFKALSNNGIKDDNLVNFLSGNYISTVFHECQHLKQFASIKAYFNGEDIEGKYVLMAYLQMFSQSNYRLDELNGVEESNYTLKYFCDMAEFDARFSEFYYMKKLLEDDRVSINAKDRLLAYLQSPNADILSLSDYGRMTPFLERLLKMNKQIFKQNFKEDEFAQKLLSLYNEVDIEEVLNTFNDMENYYIDNKAIISRLKNSIIKPIKQRGYSDKTNKEVVVNYKKCNNNEK